MKGVLEIKCIVRVDILETIVNHKIMDKYLELVLKNYSRAKIMRLYLAPFCKTWSTSFNRYLLLWYTGKLWREWKLRNQMVAFFSKCKTNGITRNRNGRNRWTPWPAVDMWIDPIITVEICILFRLYFIREGFVQQLRKAKLLVCEISFVNIWCST